MPMVIRSIRGASAVVAVSVCAANASAVASRVETGIADSSYHALVRVALDDPADVVGVRRVRGELEIFPVIFDRLIDVFQLRIEDSEVAVTLRELGEAEAFLEAVFRGGHVSGHQCGARAIGRLA